MKADPCKHAKNEQDHDACIQGEQTKAAQDSAQWTFWTVIVSAVGGGLVFASLIFSGLATKAALDAAKSSREQLQLDYRARLHVRWFPDSLMLKTCHMQYGYCEH